MLPLAFIRNLFGEDGFVILILALLIFGHRLPEVARSLGRSVNEFKKGMREGEDDEKKKEITGTEGKEEKH